MAKSGNQLAKSLHTVSVLVNLGRHCMQQHGLMPGPAVQRASVILGLDDKEDVYGLKAQAIKQLGGMKSMEPTPPAMPAPREEPPLEGEEGDRDTRTYSVMSD